MLRAVALMFSADLDQETSARADVHGSLYGVRFMLRSGVAYLCVRLFKYDGIYTSRSDVMMNQIAGPFTSLLNETPRSRGIPR